MVVVGLVAAADIVLVGGMFAEEVNVGIVVWSSVLVETDTLPEGVVGLNVGVLPAAGCLQELYSRNPIALPIRTMKRKIKPARMPI